jgi:hypothetical protein
MRAKKLQSKVFQIQEQFQNMPPEPQGESLMRFAIWLPQTPPKGFNARAACR